MTEQCEGANRWPSPDDVRQAIEGVERQWVGEPVAILAAARAYLEIREAEDRADAAAFLAHEREPGEWKPWSALGRACREHAPRHPALTIEQVVAACDTDAVLVFRHGPGAVVLRAEKPAMFVPDATGNTMDEAIQQLGRDAIAKIKGRHAADAAKLRELGVSDV